MRYNYFIIAMRNNIYLFDGILLKPFMENTDINKFELFKRKWVKNDPKH